MRMSQRQGRNTRCPQHGNLVLARRYFHLHRGQFQVEESLLARYQVQIQ